MRPTQLIAAGGVELGGMVIPAWALWLLALVVILIIIGVVVFRLARRARKIARATHDASRGADSAEEPHGFGFFGAVTSAISIIPDVKSKSRTDEDPDLNK